MYTSHSFLLEARSSSASASMNCVFKSLLSIMNYKVCQIDLNSLKQIDQNAFVFIDARALDIRQLLSVCMQITISTKNIVVFNLSDSDHSLSTQLLQLGARGVFYLKDSPENIVKGLTLIKQEKRWFSRVVLEASIDALLQRPIEAGILHSVAPARLSTQTKHIDNTLTKRELSIVSLVSQGAQNKEIANALNISVNTVKTHIYSVFRKTNCRNRVELMSWSINKIPNYID